MLNGQKNSDVIPGVLENSYGVLYRVISVSYVSFQNIAIAHERKTK